MQMIFLATAYVNANGKFSANWSVSDVDADGIADVYAVLEAKEIYYRSTTCDASGMTFDFGGDCQNVIPIRISGVMQPPAPPVPEEDIPEESFDGDEYIEYFFNHKFKKTPLIAIVPQPDSYDKVRSAIIPAQEGVMLWTSLLEKRNGGDWDVNFEIISPGKTFSQKPDIIMNVVWYDNNIGCNSIRGVAYLGPGFSQSGDSINTVVCASIFGERVPNVAISNTAAHEFIHAVGLGHAWNKPGDLMCSSEPKRSPGGGSVQTCGLSSGISELNTFFVIREPSDMDLATVERMYNKDGFKNPNLNIQICKNPMICEIPRFTVEDFQGIGTSTENNIPTRQDETRNDVKPEETSETKTRNDVKPEETSETKTRNDVKPEETSETKPPVYEVEKEKPDDVIENVTSLKIKSDKEYYVVGDKVWIEGVALSTTSNVNLKIIDPEGNLVKMIQSDVMKYGNFDATFDIEKQFFPLAGGYDIIAWQSSASEDTDVINIKIGIKGGEKKLGVPAWIKNNADWWAKGAIDDDSFVQGIQFMIKENIISIPNLPESSSETAETVPAWIKNNAGWWADGQIDDNSFVQGIEYLVKVGIIKV